MTGSPRRSALLSAFIHALAILLILIVASSKNSVLTKLMPIRDTPIYTPPLRIHLQWHNGGGGQHSPLPLSKGPRPPAARRVFTPPVMTVQETHPLIEMPPTVQAAVATEIPLINLQFGSPTGVMGPSSGGPGRGGGLGSGDGLSAGDGKGPGEGDGPGGDGYGLHGKNVTQPVLLTRTDPEYSEEARKAKFQGMVELSIVVNAAGQVTHVQVLRGAGLGLDEKAVEAVRQWKFRAGTVNGKAVSTRAVVEVNFRLL